MAVSRLTTVAVLAVALNQAGCASRQTYAEFAQAGETYATAMDRLLLASAKLAVDANSWKLINNDAISNYDTKQYREDTTLIEERLGIVVRLRSHAKLLGDYFGQLRLLATSDAPERIGKSLGATAVAINSLGDTLRRDASTGREPLIPNPEVFQELGQIAVSFAIQAALRAEFVARQELIRRELRTQQLLLTRLSRIIEDDVEAVKQSRIARLVIIPLAKQGPVEKPEQWVETRRDAMMSSAAISAELGTASKAAATLRQSFEDLVQGKLSAADLEALAKQVESLVIVIKTIESEGRSAK